MSLKEKDRHRHRHARTNKQKKIDLRVYKQGSCQHTYETVERE